MQLTKISTFLLIPFFVCALTTLRTVERGYSVLGISHDPFQLALMCKW